MNEEYAITDGTGEVDNRPLSERIGDKVCNLNSAGLHPFNMVVFFLVTFSSIISHPFLPFV